MGRRKKGQLQPAPNCDSGRTKLARLYQQQDQQERLQWPKQQEVRSQYWRGTYCLITAGIILAAFLLAAFVLLVVESLSISSQRAEECSQRYDNVTKISSLLYEHMKSQVEDRHVEIDSLKCRVQELQQMHEDEIQRSVRDEELLLKKENDIQNLIEENGKLQEAIKDRDGQIHMLTSEFDGERKKLEHGIAKCEREKQQMRTEESEAWKKIIPNTGTMGIISLGVLVVIIVGSFVVFGGKR